MIESDTNYKERCNRAIRYRLIANARRNVVDKMRANGMPETLAEAIHLEKNAEVPDLNFVQINSIRTSNNRFSNRRNSNKTCYNSNRVGYISREYNEQNKPNSDNEQQVCEEDEKNNRCFKCHKPGHRSCDCRQRRPNLEILLIRVTIVLNQIIIRMEIV